MPASLALAGCAILAAVTWDPAQYGRFRDERAQPFHDLLALVERRPGLRVLDLGCGTGELTRALHLALSARETVGIDSSPAMLARAPAAPGLRFEPADIASFTADAPFDLVFSNAALHWLPDHAALLPRLATLVAPGGQLAVQVPRNEAHPSHRAAEIVALAMSRELGGYVRRSPVQGPAQYAALLHALGFSRQHVRLQVYPHLLPGRAHVVEWVKGSLLTDYEQRLGAADFARFLERYREVLLPQLADDEPFLYTYDRVLFWGAQPAPGGA